MSMFNKLKTAIISALVLVPLAIMSGCTGDTNNNSSTNPNPNIFTPTGTVSGLLRDSVTNAPLANAKVSIMDRSTTTNDQGLFTITNVPALTGIGNEAGATNAPYPVVIDMSAINSSITAFNAVAANTVKKAFYPSTAYTVVSVTYTSLGETSQVAGNTNATNHDTPVQGFVANIVPFVGKLDAGIKMQVVDTSLKPVVGASVYLFANAGTNAATTNTTTGGTSVAGSVTPGHLVQGPLTSDANGFVTFANIEAKQTFAIKATFTDGREGWYTAATLPLSVGVNAQLAAQGIVAPADGLTDLYAVQGGDVFSGLGAGAAYNTATVITTNDGVAPFILTVTPSNLADIAIPATGDLTITYTFSEPIRSTNYSNAVSRDLAANNGNRGLYNNVVVSYLGPKIGNINHTIAWSTDRTQLLVTIPATSLTAASRYSVNITSALDGSATAGDRLTDNNRNNFSVFTNASTFFTTNGNFNVAAPVIAKTNASNSLAIEWPSVTNAATYKIYVAKTNIAPYAALGTAVNGTTVFAPAGAFPTFNMNSIPGFSLANGVVYTVKVTTVNGGGSESDFSNEISFSEVAPAAPAGVARRAAAANITETHVDWTQSANVSGYKVYVERVVAGVGQGFGVPVFSAVPTIDVAGQLTLGIGGDVFADGQNKVTYNVKVTALGLFGSESVASTIVVIDDKTTPTAVKGGVTAAAPIAISTTIQGTATVAFNKPMVFSDLVNPSSWAWTFAGATTATVSQAFGSLSAVATPISVNATATTVTALPWSVTTNATGTVAAGAVTLSCTAKSVGGALAVTGSF